jgi:hypothetical protein
MDDLWEALIDCKLANKMDEATLSIRITIFKTLPGLKLT